jgi:predicted RNase H-like HicB family nuclease
MKRPPTYTVSDGKLTLTLKAAGNGWYAVTSPLDPEIVTQARTIAEAFEMAYDAQAALHAARERRFKQMAAMTAST